MLQEQRDLKNHVSFGRMRAILYAGAIAPYPARGQTKMPFSVFAQWRQKRAFFMEKSLSDVREKATPPDAGLHSCTGSVFAVPLRGGPFQDGQRWVKSKGTISTFRPLAGRTWKRCERLRSQRPLRQGQRLHLQGRAVQFQRGAARKQRPHLCGKGFVQKIQRPHRGLRSSVKAQGLRQRVLALLMEPSGGIGRKLCPPR